MLVGHFPVFIERGDAVSLPHDAGEVDDNLSRNNGRSVAAGLHLPLPFVGEIDRRRQRQPHQGPPSVARVRIGLLELRLGFVEPLERPLDILGVEDALNNEVVPYADTPLNVGIAPRRHIAPDGNIAVEMLCWY